MSRTRTWTTVAVALALVVGGAGLAAADEAPDVAAAGDALVELAGTSTAPEQDVLEGAVQVSADLAVSEDGYAQVEGDVAMIPLASGDPIVLSSDSGAPFEVTDPWLGKRSSAAPDGMAIP